MVHTTLITALLPFLPFVTGADLYYGAVATVAHSLAAMYIGISIVFGKSMIHWADERFLYYIKKQGSKPTRRTGWDYARHSMKGSLQHLLSFIIGATLLVLMIYLIDTPSRTEELSATLKCWAIILAIDFFISITYFIWPRSAKAQ